MMRRGRQAADDGSFARSVGVHTLRGAVLIGIALLLGIVLLQKMDTGTGATTQVNTDTPTSVPVTRAPATTTSTRPASQVKVLVANGTTTVGAALTAKNAVAQAGYNALAATDATPAAKAAKRNTTVYYAAGYETDAGKIGALLGLSTAPAVAPMPAPGAGLPVADLKGANVLVVIGPDYVTRAGAPGPSTSTTRNL
jgi:hypothetical protein